jgi:hypothetical protein
LFQLVNERLREGIDVDFQTQTERRARTNAGTDTTEIRTLDGVLKVKRAAPKRFVAESIKAESISSLLDKSSRVRENLRVEISQLLSPNVTLRWWTNSDSFRGRAFSASTIGDEQKDYDNG